MVKPLLVVAVLGLAGCASVTIPADRLERSEASLRSAEAVGAMDVPDARLHLELAKDQFTEARKLASQGDSRALLVQSRAEADAELALALARESTMHADALKANEDLRAVRARPAN